MTTPEPPADAQRVDAGWAKRQIENTERNAYEWPEWMRREAGIPEPEKNALNELRARLRAVEAERDEAWAELDGAVDRAQTRLEERDAAQAEARRLREALGSMVQWFEQIHAERYEHAGAMNATRLSERDLGRKVLAKARAALSPPAQAPNNREAQVPPAKS